MLKVRPATPADAPSLAGVWNAAHPENVRTEGAFRTPSSATSGWLLATSNGRPVGYLQYGLSQRQGDPPDKYWAYLTLSQEGREVTAGLYEAISNALIPRGARVLYTMTQETQLERLDVLASLGFAETLRSYGANLEVASVDLAKYGEPERRLEREGIVIRTLAELRRDPAYARKLYGLYLETNRDVPEVGHDDTKSYEDFVKHLEREDALPEAYFVTVKGGECIGYSELFASEQADRLNQETTAVRRAYRRRGVALALKLRGVAYAKRHGIHTINTGMASNNTAMVALNTRLGFVPKPAWITFRKDLL